MPYAILRVAKLKTAQQAAAKTAHNYRQRETPNAELDRKDLNHEYLNTQQRDYWSLANERIAKVGAKVRGDSVRGVEVILTASPEAFARDERGRAQDMRGSAWAEANVAFLQAKFGKENVVAATLHQDELTPHFQAVIVPITADGRLSAKELFNPKTLRALQTEYAVAMKPYGLERGVEHSRAKHEVMRRVYGVHARSQDQAAELGTPAPVERLRIEGPSGLDLINLSQWRAEQEARLNAELTRQLTAAHARAEKAAELAQDASTGKDRAQTLARQVASLEGAKTAALRERDEAQGHLTRLAVGLAQGEPASARALDYYAQRVRADEHAQLESRIAQVLKTPLRVEDELEKKLKALPGYAWEQEDGRPLALRHAATGSRFALRELAPGGVPMNEAVEHTYERTRQQDQDHHQSQGM